MRSRPTVGQRGVRGRRSAKPEGAAAPPQRAAVAASAPARQRRRVGLFFLSDLAALVVASLLTAPSVGQALILGVSLVLGAWVLGLYRWRLTVSALDDLPRLLQAWLVASALTVLIAQFFLTESGTAVFCAVAFAAVAVGRFVSAAVVRRLRRTGLISHPTLIVGADSTGRFIASKIMEETSCGVHTLGFLDDRVDDGVHVRMLGRPQDIADVLAEHSPKVVIVARGHGEDGELVAMVRACHRHACEIFLLPRLHEVSDLDGDDDRIGGVPLVRLHRRAYRTWEWRLKRALDVVVSGVALVLLAPLMGLIALAVRLDGGPGVIFRQVRVSVDGTLFQVLKFRSMRPVNEAESQTQWNIANDPRLGKLGRLLRATSLDELPQLWNILRGDMSLVGPRPERPFYVQRFAELYGGYDARHRVPCGLTGWAQVHGLRGDTSIPDRARYDNFYIENWSLWLDIKIILLTFSSLFSRPGA